MVNNNLVALSVILFLFFYYFFLAPKLAVKESPIDSNPNNSWYVESDPGSYVDNTDYLPKENNRQKNLPSAYVPKKREPPIKSVRNPNVSRALGLTGLPSLMAPVPLSTSLQKYEDGKVYYLDRHELQCPSNKILNSFKLTEGNGNKVRFDYSCISGIDVNSRDRYNPSTVSPAKYTEFSDAKGGKLSALQNQGVTCGADGFLNNLMLQRDSSGKKIRYKYRCSNVNKSDPSQKGTGFNGGDKITSLTKHNIQCNPTKGLTGFKMQSNKEKNKYQYVYDCATPLN
jgi:hypothetical protein